MKAIFMIEDIRAKLEIENNGGVVADEVFVFDSKGITTKHLLKIEMGTIRAIMKYIQVNSSYIITKS